VPFASLDPKAAHSAMTGDGGHVFFDVRTVEEYEAGHPAGAVNIPWAVRDASGQMAPNPAFVEHVSQRADKGQKVFVSCQAGGRSFHACKALEQAGFTDLVNVDGGYGGRRDPTGQLVVAGWVECGLPTASESSDWSGAPA